MPAVLLWVTFRWITGIQLTRQSKAVLVCQHTNNHAFYIQEKLLKMSSDHRGTLSNPSTGQSASQQQELETGKGDWQHYMPPSAVMAAIAAKQTAAPQPTQQQQQVLEPQSNSSNAARPALTPHIPPTMRPPGPPPAAAFPAVGMRPPGPPAALPPPHSNLHTPTPPPPAAATASAHTSALQHPYYPPAGTSHPAQPPQPFHSPSIPPARHAAMMQQPGQDMHYYANAMHTAHAPQTMAPATAPWQAGTMPVPPGPPAIMQQQYPTAAMQPQSNMQQQQTQPDAETAAAAALQRTGSGTARRPSYFAAPVLNAAAGDATAEGNDEVSAPGTDDQQLPPPPARPQPTPTQANTHGGKADLPPALKARLMARGILPKTDTAAANGAQAPTPAAAAANGVEHPQAVAAAQVEPKAVAPQHLQPAAVSTTSQQALLPGWFTAVDPTYNHTYYYNPTTGERSWTPPTVAPAAPLVTATASDGTLPPGWVEALDPNTGHK